MANLDNLNNILINPEQVTLCKRCNMSFPLSDFIGNRGQKTVGCKKCRDKDIERDKMRDKEHLRELQRKNYKNPQNLERKQKWKEDNHDKCALYWLNSRKRQIDENQEAYLKKQAEQAKKWREKNPEKMAIANEKKKNDPKQNFNVYKRCADIKNLTWEFTFEQYEELVKNPCHYCGIIQERGFNGIDRTNQQLDYTIENCVSCCKICNYMKGCLSDEVFIKKIEHILTNLCLIENGKLYPELFKDNKTKYNSYKTSANKRNIEFLITKEDFESIILQNCYICGKNKSETHNNGIDRFDNNIGYLFENCRSCCGQCNFIKKDLSYKDMIDKMINIHKNNKVLIIDKLKSTLLNKQDTIQNLSFIQNNKNKKTQEERTEMVLIRKQNQREQQKKNMVMMNKIKLEQNSWLNYENKRKK